MAAAAVPHRPMAARYDGTRGLLCPHVVGYNEPGEWRAFCYQYGGETRSGTLPGGDEGIWSSIGHFYFAQIGHYHFAPTDPFGPLSQSSDCSNIGHVNLFGRPMAANQDFVWRFSMRRYSGVLIAGLSLLAGAIPVMAHHSFAAEYDSNKPVTISGKVTKVEWMNPHARFYVDVKGTDGKVTNWNFELGAIPVLLKQGWRKDSLKEGDQVTVEGSRAKDGSFSANARRVSLPDGRRVFAGSSAPSADQ